MPSHSGPPFRALALESSCDETGVALFCSEKGLLSNQLHSQIQLHQHYGGVVPEHAARAHVAHVLPLCQAALAEAQLDLHDLSGIAYTAGPGLIGALMTGAAFAAGLSFATSLPLWPTHHLEGHLLAVGLSQPMPPFPFVVLLVSGGHTALIMAHALGVYETLGQTLDDAAGEAFDKTAKLMGFPYPGGADLARLAQKGRSGRFTFPRPMWHSPNCDLSFSGLKTHAWQALEAAGHAGDLNEDTRADLALAFEEAAVAVLCHKTARALNNSGAKHLVVAGGVAANLALRQHLHRTAEQAGAQLHLPEPQFCTDNAAMIAHAAVLRVQAGIQSTSADHNLHLRPRWPLDDLKA